MAESTITLRQEIRGLRELQREGERIVRELHGDEMLTGMRRATLLVQTEAKKLAPVDTGRLRASIMPDIRTERHAVIGAVGTTVLYGPYMETGARPHWPPPGALDVWARRHGIDPFVLARVIARKGVKAHPFLQPAFEQKRDRIMVIIGETVEGIVTNK